MRAGSAAGRVAMAGGAAAVCHARGLCHAVRGCAMQHSGVPCSAGLCRAVQCDTGLCDAVVNGLKKPQQFIVI